MYLDGLPGLQRLRERAQGRRTLGVGKHTPGLWQDRAPRVVEIVEVLLVTQEHHINAANRLDTDR